jgi:hypothetical protein
LLCFYSTTTTPTIRIIKRERMKNNTSISIRKSTLVNYIRPNVDKQVLELISAKVLVLDLEINDEKSETYF